MTDFKNEVKKIAESLDWNIDIDNKEFTFSKYSPAGQDFSFSVNADNIEELIDNTRSYCDSYDCSEEAYLWLDNTGHGTNGAPYDMKDLYEDMEACLEMAEKLRDEIEKLSQ